MGKVSTSEPRTVDNLPYLSVSAVNIKETAIGIGGVLLVQNTVEGGLRKVFGDRATMTLCIDIWATSTPLIEEISQKVTQFIFTNQTQLRSSGFLCLNISKISEVVSVTLGLVPPTHSYVYKRRLEYRCIYEKIAEIVNQLDCSINKPGIDTIGRIVK